jgi:hypothetical protein
MVAGLMVIIVGLIAIIGGRRETVVGEHATPGYECVAVGCVPVVLTSATCLEIISIAVVYVL